MEQRSCGLLCHVTSLPSAYGIGDLGPEAYRFVDMLASFHQRYWQILPMNPTNPMSGNSPYSSDSAFAGNPLLISPDECRREGLVSDSDLNGMGPFPSHETDFDRVIPAKEALLTRAFERFTSKKTRWQTDFDAFCQTHHAWLEDYVTYRVLKNHFEQKPWSEWPQDVRLYRPAAIDKLKARYRRELEYYRFVQFLFYRQWNRLKQYSNEQGVNIIGDIPYYVNTDSADVWSHQDLFKLNAEHRPEVVAGVPPDYFSNTGQLWGNPIYDWKALQKTEFEWWLLRIGHNLSLFDQIRIDHFRGLVAYWQVPAEEETAINGTWVEVPVYPFLNAVHDRFPDLPIIAEDLGFITDDVRQVLTDFNLPGMKVLQFAFDESLPGNAYAPHHHVPNSVVYIGTHDNDTLKGWYMSRDDATKSRLGRYIGKWLDDGSVHWDMIHMTLKSVATLTILTLQDLIGLGTDARMNIPGTLDGNWGWRFRFEDIPPDVHGRLAEMMELTGRIPGVDRTA
jgi:4-alpha-glucanotransferase